MNGMWHVISGLYEQVPHNTLVSGLTKTTASIDKAQASKDEVQKVLNHRGISWKDGYSP